MLEGGMLISVQTLNPLPFLIGTSFRKRSQQCKARQNSSTTPVQLSSSVPLTDRSGNNWEQGSNTSLLTQPNTVGVIGGVSVLSTLIFLEKLACWSSRNGKECPPFVVCSDPVLSKVLPIRPPYRSSDRSRIDQIKMNQEVVIQNLRRKRKILQLSGAGCFVMPCHLSHAWYSEISEDSSLPFFHVGDCMAMELKNSNLKPIHASSSVRIGLLTTDSVLVASYYQHKLQNQVS
ncbi:hypothetical protein PIB30_071656 [Stylosanthes scabra]|uniref:Uncharacterized protein n=1 Tax=Stylosanthes scabra TaxID=79078 RepID=A0ABU6QPW4_9FABA|nr:hypothetical protein [Stylosanthes scabra]